MSRRNRANAQPPIADHRLIGYARVSTQDQSLEMQCDALRAAGVLDDNLHQEHGVSGVAKKRPRLEEALLDAVAGDTFVVWKLDRLGRSVSDLVSRIEAMEARGVKFRSLTEGIDTATPAGRLIMHVIGAIAQFERDLIRERTRAGMAAKRARGHQFGRPQKVDIEKARQMFRAGKSVQQVAAAFDCSVQAVYKYFDYHMVSALIEEGRQQRAKGKRK